MCSCTHASEQRRRQEAACAGLPGHGRSLLYVVLCWAVFCLTVAGKPPMHGLLQVQACHMHCCRDGSLLWRRLQSTVWRCRTLFRLRLPIRHYMCDL